MVSSVPASENGGSRREARWLLEGNVGRWGPRALRDTHLKGEGLLCAWSSWRAVGGAEAWCWQTDRDGSACFRASGPPLRLCHTPRQAAWAELPAPVRCNPVTAAQLAGPLTAQLVFPIADPPSASSW